MMADINWQVISRWDEALSNNQPDERFVYVDIAARITRAKRLLPKQCAGVVPGELKRFCYIEGAAEILCETEPEIVQVDNRPVFIPYLQKRLPNSGFVLFMHNTSDFTDGRVLSAVDICDQLVFVSQALADQWCKRYPQCERKSRVIRHGIDDRVWRSGLESHAKTLALRKQFGLKIGRTILFVGRTIPPKGLHCLLDAMRWVLMAMPDAKLVVVGSPLFGALVRDIYLKRMKDFAQCLGDRIIFTGFVARETLPYYYAAADVVVVPSLFPDPLPTVVLEALACGVPVIGSRRGGIPEMIQDGKWGILVDDPTKTQNLAGQILKVLGAPKWRGKLGKAALKKINHQFSKEKRIQKMYALYESFF